MNAGAARRKREAEGYAAIDLIIEPAGMGIDVAEDPPNLAGRRRAIAAELFGAGMRCVRRCWRPWTRCAQTSKRSPRQRGGFVLPARFYCRGVPIVVPLSLSLSSAVAVANGGGGVVSRWAEQVQGQGTCPPGGNVVGGSPGGPCGRAQDGPDTQTQDAALHIPPLPDNALDALVWALGSCANRRERMGRHKGAMAHRILEHRRGRSWAARAGLPSQLPSSTLGRMTMRNDVFLAEEQLRAEEAHRNPNGRCGRMRAARDVLPITAVLGDLVESLRSGRVVVVSGGTNFGKSTQCPQSIFEDAITHGRGAKTRIVVT